MSEVELYVVIPYQGTDDDDFEPWVPIECEGLGDAVRTAGELCGDYSGAVVFSCIRDTASLHCGSYKVVRKFGIVPEDPVGMM